MASRRRVSLSNQHQTIDDPNQWLQLVTSALLDRAAQIKHSADSAVISSESFGLTFEMVDQQAREGIEECDRLATLALFAAVEAGLQIDYQNRIRRRTKTGKSLNRRFKQLDQDVKKRKLNAPPIEWILNAWKQEHTAGAQKAGDLLKAFGFRHWLAHGRYWVHQEPGLNHDVLLSLASRLYAELTTSRAAFYPGPR